MPYKDLKDTWKVPLSRELQDRVTRAARGFYGKERGVIRNYVEQTIEKRLEQEGF